jgi:hypothetical protein
MYAIFFILNEISALFSIKLAQDASPEKHVRYKTQQNQALKLFSRHWRLMIESLS